MREHIPKRCGNLEEPIKSDKVFDNTADRIYGERQYSLNGTESALIGAGHNPADDLPKIGRKTFNSDREVSFFLVELFWFQILLKVQEEMKEKQRIADLAREQRFFETTSKADFTQKDL